MSTATRRRSQPALGWGEPSSHVPREELAVLRAWHPNVLIGGPRDTVSAMLASLQGVFRPIVVRWTTGVALPVPPGANARTLVLEDVDALSRDEQEQLFRWLKQNDRAVQVVATTTQPLAQLVDSGEFDSRLYYALNVIHIRIPS
jgi:hypothetical protein